ncbi:Cupin domain protein [Tenacibaculum sp. 190524A02b]|uniref:Cupin domain protein n=2 Tax=Tenacibaculum vairaonense TaxID=3137860 RepID=A0ABM9PLR9_9FLAO
MKILMRIKFVIGYLIVITLLGCKQSTEGITKIQVTELAKTSRSWNGTDLPTYPEGTPEVTVLKIEIPPKTKLKWHKHPVINAGVLLKGELTVISRKKDTLYLKAGDPIVELVNQWHYGENKDIVPAEIIVFYAGIKDKPITVIE